MAQEFVRYNLPLGLLQQATLRGNEHAWQIDDIPDVIVAAQRANLVNIGGQLQFRLPENTCECYWISVDTYQSVSEEIAWHERVQLTPEVALQEFDDLQSRYDFVAEIRDGFTSVFDELVAMGGNPTDYLCFAWYLLSEKESVRSKR